MSLGGVKPGTQSKKARLAAERAAILEKAKGTPMEGLNQ